MLPFCHKHDDKPIIRIILSGTKADSTSSNNSSSNNNININDIDKDDGMSVRLKVQGFKLAGDKGKRVPKLKLESVSVTMVLRVSIILEFDSQNKKVSGRHSFIHLFICFINC